MGIIKIASETKTFIKIKPVILHLKPNLKDFSLKKWTYKHKNNNNNKKSAEQGKNE